MPCEYFLLLPFYFLLEKKTMQRKAYRLKAGNVRNLKIITESLPDPSPDEVTVEVKAIGLNFADVFAIWGLYSAIRRVSLHQGWNIQV